MASIQKLKGTAFLAFPEMKNMLTSELSERFGYGKIVASATIAGKSFAAPDSKRSLSSKNSAGSQTALSSGWYGDLLYCADLTADQLAEGFGASDRPGTEKSPSEAKNQPLPYWARTVLLEPFILRFESIGEAAGALKEIQRNWAPYQYQLFRRASLIQEKLPYINLKTRKFPSNIPDSPMGIYTLLDEKTILASAVTNSPVPAGRIEFEEDHENPPSRAYLKIQESLTLYKTFFDVELPKEGDKCFEAGACPGGWTWVLRLLGADVFAVDRAELAPSLMKDPHVKFMAHDAFTLKPEEVCAQLECEKLDWLLSDVICYPERLLEWINLWRDSRRVKNIICTIKMQGAINWDLIKVFSEIPQSRILHLNYNKHELTIMIRNE